MTSLANTVKNVAGNALANAKAKDLDRNTQDPKDVRYGGKITNNHGVRLTQTENWCVCFGRVALVLPLTRIRFQAESFERPDYWAIVD